jgi:hypothetical protein
MELVESIEELPLSFILGREIARRLRGVAKHTAAAALDIANVLVDEADCEALILRLASEPRFQRKTLSAPTSPTFQEHSH